MSKQRNKFIHIIRTKDNKWQCQYKARNGEILAVSETFNSRKAAVNNADSMASRFLANHPTAEQLADFFLCLAKTPIDNTGDMTEQDMAAKFAQRFLSKFLTVRDELKGHIVSERRKEQ